MFGDFFSKLYYGNTVGQWLMALLIVFASLIIARIVYWIFTKWIKKLATKTETKLDDIIVDMIEEPISFAVVLVAIWYTLNYQLSFSEDAHNFFHNIFYGLIIFNIAWMINRLFGALINQYVVPIVEKTEGDLDDVLLPIVRKGISFIIWSLAIIIGLNNAGYDVGALLAGLGVGGLAFALAAQDTVANLFGGFTILTDKPFSVGDKVTLSGNTGIVKEIGLRTTRIKTVSGEVVSIPNSKIANNAATNKAGVKAFKAGNTIRLSYNMDKAKAKIDLAMSILREIAGNHTEAIGDFYILAFTGFSENSLNIEFSYFVQSGADFWGTQTAINLSILEQFAENKIEFAKEALVKTA